MKHTLRNVIWTELRKSMHSKALWTAVAIGLVFSALNIIETYDAFQESVETVIDMRTRGYLASTAYSLFRAWMGHGGSYGAAMFFAVWPVLAAMAFGWSYNNERISGVYNQIAIRVGRRRYFTAKHTAVFVSGGIAMSFPVLIDLLVLAMIYPAGSGAGLNDSHFLCALNAENPWAYCLVWSGMLFLLGGAVACVCHVVGTYLRHGVMVVLTPYAILIAVDALTTMLRTAIAPKIIRYTISPLQMVYNGGWANPGWLLFGTILLMTLGSYAIGYWQVKRHELV